MKAQLIPRHHLPTESAEHTLKRHGKSFERFLEVVENKHFILSSLAQHALSRATSSLVLGGDQAQILDWLRSAHLARAWHWHVMHSEGPVEVSLPGRAPITMPCPVKGNIDVHLSTFERGIHFSLIFRDRAAADVYAKVPLERYHSTASGIEFRKPDVLVAYFLQAFAAQRADAVQLYKQWSAAATPEAYSFDPNFHEEAISPYVELWGHLLLRDADGFNDALRAFLEGWRRRYDTPETNEFPDTYVCWEALGPACVALDNGIPVTVESDYLPPFLLSGEHRLHWPGMDWV